MFFFMRLTELKRRLERKRRRHQRCCRQQPTDHLCLRCHPSHQHQGVDQENSGAGSEEPASILHFSALVTEPTFYREVGPMETSPDDKPPGSSMPQPAQEHGKHEIDIGSAGPLSVPT